MFHQSVKNAEDRDIVNMENGRLLVLPVMVLVSASMVLKSILVDPAVVMDIANII